MNATEEIFMINALPSSSQPSTSTQKLSELVLSSGPQVNLENVKDFSHVCRTCATITEFVIPIFAGEGLQNNLADKIHKHLPIQVCVEDKLPVVLCYQCSSTLLAWHELVQCCLHADTALRARLATDTLQEPRTSNVTTNSIENEPQPKSIYTIVKSVLVDYFHNIVDEEDSDVEFVCQKCVEQPRLLTAHSLAEHILHAHSPSGDTHTRDTVNTFITDNITFEQALAPNDSDTEIQASVEKLKPQTDKNKKTSQAAAATLYCPYCPAVFSSATRLVHHLNKHVQVSMAAGVLCCDLLYHDKKLFVKHLQEAHIDRDDATREALIQVTCGSCGYITDHVDKLKEHCESTHEKLKNKKVKKVENPDNQKLIPAVCPECNKTFSNKYNMFVHMRCHSAAKLYTCDVCAKTYSSQANLNTHKKVVHQGKLDFTCSVCKDAFGTRLERDVHARIHTGETPYKCEHCGKAYRAKNTLNRHMEIHLGIKKHQCAICSKKFRRKSHLDRHIETHMKYSGMSQYRVESPPQYGRACAYCRWRARDTPHYQEHLITAHSDLLFYCEECDKYISRKDFILHMSLHATQYTGQDKTVKRKKIRMKEDDDDRSTSELRKSTEDLDSASERINNSENSNQENEFSDHSDMDYEFGPLPESVFEAIEDSQDSQLLENDENNTGENGRVSDESNKTIRLTIESNTISNISNTITSTEMHSLSSCAVTIEHNSTLSVTVSSNVIAHDTTANDDNSNSNSGAKTPDSSAIAPAEESDNGKKQYPQHKKIRTCPICAKVYTASSSYFYHMKYFHKGSREHECEVCGKKFTTKPSLTQHMAIHNGQYDLQCKVCEKKFKFKASLYIHEQTHNGKKVWSCNQCHRSFRWRTHLTRHMKRHASEKTHVCTICGRGFSIRCDLLRHARTHTVGNFSCDKCGQKFAQLRYLKVHIARQHSINIVKESL